MWILFSTPVDYINRYLLEVMSMVNNNLKMELLKSVFYMDMVEGTHISDELQRLFEVMNELSTMDFKKWVADYKDVAKLEEWLKENDLETYYNELKEYIENN